MDHNPEIVGIKRPFRGLESFQAEHAPLFFGRNKEADELTNRIRKNGFVVLTGPSGSGKSSLIQAGVIPQFRDAKLILMRPGDQPLQALIQALGKRVRRDRQEKLTDAMLMGDTAQVFSIMQEETSKENDLTVLVVDQGEEIVTLCDDIAIRDRFTSILSELGGYSSSNLRVVYSLREDFFGPVGAVDRIKSIFARQVMVISTPKPEDLMETLIGPAHMFGYQIEDHSLLQEIIQTVEHEYSALALLAIFVPTKCGNDETDIENI